MKMLNYNFLKTAAQKRRLITVSWSLKKMAEVHKLAAFMSFFITSALYPPTSHMVTSLISGYYADGRLSSCHAGGRLFPK